MKLLLFVLCTLLAVGCNSRSVEDTNAILDGIFSDAAKNMRHVVLLPDLEITESYSLLGLRASVTAYGAYVNRQEPFVVRSEDGHSGGQGDVEVMEAHVSSAVIAIRLDNMTVETGLFTVKSSALLKFQGKYHFEITVGKDEKGSCTSNVMFFDLPTPQLVEFTSGNGMIGTVFDIFVYFVDGIFGLRKVILKFFGPVFSAITTKEIEQAVNATLCKPSQ